MLLPLSSELLRKRAHAVNHAGDLLVLLLIRKHALLLAALEKIAIIPFTL